MPRLFITGERSREELSAEVEALWQGYLTANPDMDGEESFYEDNWTGTLGLEPGEVQASILRVMRLVSYYDRDAREAEAACLRAAQEMDAAGRDLETFTMEEAAALYAQGGWEVEAEETLVPSGFLAYLAEVFVTWTRE